MTHKNFCSPDVLILFAKFEHCHSITLAWVEFTIENCVIGEWGPILFRCAQILNLASDVVKVLMSITSIKKYIINIMYFIAKIIYPDLSEQFSIRYTDIRIVSVLSIGENRKYIMDQEYCCAV